jgi:hypothetical protein
MLENTLLLPPEPLVPPAPTVTVSAVPLATEKPEAVLKPPAPPPPLLPAPPPATTKYSTVGVALDKPSLYPFADEFANVESIGIFSPYANLVCVSRTV